jgi:hypothetical protein
MGILTLDTSKVVTQKKHQTSTSSRFELIIYKYEIMAEAGQPTQQPSHSQAQPQQLEILHALNQLSIEERIGRIAKFTPCAHSLFLNVWMFSQILMTAMFL